MGRRSISGPIPRAVTIEASLESSWQGQNAPHVDFSGEVDVGCCRPSDDDPDDPNYKLPASSWHTKPLEDSASNSEVTRR